MRVREMISWLNINADENEHEAVEGGDSGDSKAKYSWVIAILLCVIAAMFSNLGTNLQKYAWRYFPDSGSSRLNQLDTTTDQQDDDEDDVRSVYSYPGLTNLRFKTRASSRVKAVRLPNQSPSSPYSAASTETLDRAVKSNFVRNSENGIDVSNTKDSTLPDMLEKDKEQPGKSIRRFRMVWGCGLSLVILGALFDFAALGFGAQSVVAPLGALTLVFNLCFAQLLHSEALTNHDAIATAIIIVGCILAVAFANHKNHFIGVTELLSLYTNSRFTSYLTIVLTVSILLAILLRQVEKVEKVHGKISEQYLKYSKYHRFGYPTLSGIIGAQSVLFAKSLDELLLSTAAGQGTFYKYIGSYLILLAMVSCILLQIYYLNLGLRRWDALYIVPIFQSNWIVFSVIGGGVFYGEFDDFSTLQSFTFLLGVVTTVGGVYILSLRTPRQSNITTEKRLKAKQSRTSSYGTNTTNTSPSQHRELNLA